MKKTKLFVIGAGQMRTGTNSLQIALETLYGEKCYHMVEIFKHHKDHFRLWNSCLDRGSMDRNICDKIFNGYCAAVDYPAAIFYKDLMDIYPDAKVILTVRDTNTWLKSVKDTTLKSNKAFNFFKIFMFLITGNSPFTNVLDKMIFHSFHLSTKQLQENDDLLKNAFVQYNEEVKNYVPKDRLLIFNIKEGWKPLCEFLNLPVPDEPFPHVNTTDEFQSRLTKMTNVAMMKFGSMLAILAVSGAILAKIYFGF